LRGTKGEGFKGGKRISRAVKGERLKHFGSSKKNRAKLLLSKTRIDPKLKAGRGVLLGAAHQKKTATN